MVHWNQVSWVRVGRCYLEHRAGSFKVRRRLPERGKEEGSGKTCAETHRQKRGAERGLGTSHASEAGKEEVDKPSRLGLKEPSMPP